MPNLSTTSNHHQYAQEALRALEEEVAALENELVAIEASVNSFEALIRSQLQQQILRIWELTLLYKKQKKNKKEKRLEQKKKGKNYKAPEGVRKVIQALPPAPALPPDQQQQLKRLYKEAIVLVHPDKFVNESAAVTERANALTVALNALYKQEDLEQLNQFHEHIISGNAMSYIPFKPETAVDPAALQVQLLKKKEELRVKLMQVKQLQTYQVLTTYSEPATFITELRLQFNERIQQLEKRTRKG